MNFSVRKAQRLHYKIRMININHKDDDQITESPSQEEHKRNTEWACLKYRKAKRFSHVTLGPLQDQANARCRKLITQGGKVGAKQREKILKREHF